MELSEATKYYKLNNNCKLFKCKNKNFLGNTEENILLELDDSGYEFVLPFIDGCSLDIESLTNIEKELLGAMKSYGLLTKTENQYKVTDVYLHVTDRCNLQCMGCYSYIDNRNKQKDMTLDEIKKILANAKKSGVESLIISGGEPFIRDDIIDILRYAKEELKINYILCISNGYATKEKYIEASKYIDRLSFSLDGYDKNSNIIRTPQVFEKIDTLIDSLKSKVDVSIIFTLHKKNVANKDMLSQYAERKGVDYNFSILLVKKSKFDEYEGLVFLEKDYEDLGNMFIDSAIDDSSIRDELTCSKSCGAGKRLVSIAANGDILPCHMFVEKSFVMGNALEDNIEQVVNRENNIFRDSSVDNVSDCVNCEHKYLCGGGCKFRSYVYSKNNDINSKDTLCLSYKKNIERLLSKI